MKFVIFGGAGFIGTHLTNRLIALGHSVKVFTRSDRGAKGNSNSQIVIGDIVNSEQVENATEGMDFVINLASSVIPKTSNENPIYDVQTNLIGTLNILNASVKHNVKKVIFSSSGGTIYGPSDKGAHKETDQTNPICSYGIVKLAIEKYLNMYHVLYGLKYCSLRISNPYGPGQLGLKPLGAVSIFLAKIQKGEKIEIWGDGSVRRDFIYIDDVVNALIKSCLNEQAMGVFNIASGESITLNQLIKLISEKVKIKPSIELSPKRNFDVTDISFDIDLAYEALEWKPNVALEDGISKLINGKSL